MGQLVRPLEARASRSLVPDPWRDGSNYFQPDNPTAQATLGVPEKVSADTWYWSGGSNTGISADLASFFLRASLRRATGKLYRSEGTGVRPRPTQSSGLEASALLNPGWAQRLDRLRKLEVDWDGYGAPVISQDSINECVKLLVQVNQISEPQSKQPFIAPLSDGGLELEWETSHGNELMIVVHPGGAPVEYLLTTLDLAGNELELEGNIPGDSSIEDLLKALMG